MPKIQVYYFSPTGATLEVARRFGTKLGETTGLEVEYHSYTLPQERQYLPQFKAGDVVVWATPVYAGRIPNKTLPYVQRALQGNGNPAIALVTFGNRAYDNALAELVGIMHRGGLKVFGGAAVVTRHAFSDTLGSGRPNPDDLVALDHFAGEVKMLMRAGLTTKLIVKGDEQPTEYYTPLKSDNAPAGFLKARPSCNLELCVRCGKCQYVCPMGSIESRNGVPFFAGICIKCQACRRVCDSGAISFADSEYLSHVAMLERNFAAPKANEFFLAQAVTVRPLQRSEIKCLDEFLYQAIFVPQGVAAPPRDIIEREELQVYVRDFGDHPDDRCLVAEIGGTIVGAVWCRIMNDYGHLYDDVPSLAISLQEVYRNQGIGTELLANMLRLLASEGYRGVSLSVQRANYALGMYTKLGFGLARVAGDEYILYCDLTKGVRTWSLPQRHCSHCGEPLLLKALEGEGLVPYCVACGEYRFPMYNVAVSMIVINESTGEILLIKQYGRPHFILVAGYVNRGEQVEDAVRREIKEETGMTAQRILFNRTSFFEPSNTLMCNFTAFVSDASQFCPNGEIDSWQWFSADEARRYIRQGSLAQKFLNAYLDQKN